MSQNDSTFNELDQLHAFMNKYRNEKKPPGKILPWTHSMVYEPYGSYNIPKDKYVKFKKLYVDAIAAGFNSSITEKHKDFGPIVMNFDFVHTNKGFNQRYYTDEIIIDIINLYNPIIKKYLDVTDDMLDVYVCEKLQPTALKKESHDGIHIVYPYMCTRPSLQMLMRKDFIEQAQEKNIFKKMHLVNDLKSVFDKNDIYNTPWMMYGSRKNSSSHVYYVTHIYFLRNGKYFDASIPDGISNLSRDLVSHFVDVLSCRRFSSENEITPMAAGVDLVEIDTEINKLKQKN